MGWVRHYHGYCFHDGKDGAVFGPINSTVRRDSKQQQQQQQQQRKWCCLWTNPTAWLRLDSKQQQQQEG
jgi:hypothetical protein